MSDGIGILVALTISPKVHFSLSDGTGVGPSTTEGSSRARTCGDSVAGPALTHMSTRNRFTHSKPSRTTASQNAEHLTISQNLLLHKF